MSEVIEVVVAADPAVIEVVQIEGIPGPQGPQGPQGDQGIQGIQGIQGVKGDKGDQGIQGIQGPQGDQGIQGIQGIQGVKGDKGDQGDQGIQGIQGDKGDQGDQGIQGIQGIQGVKGDTGNTGPQGPSGTISVTSPITNSGTSTAAALGFDQAAQNTTNDARYLRLAGYAGREGVPAGSVETFSRHYTTNIATTASSGFAFFTFFSPQSTTTVSQITMASVNAQVGATGARMGLYTFDGTTATLVAQTANDATLFSVPNTIYTRSFATTGGFPSTYTLNVGEWYAVAIIIVGASTAASLPARSASSVLTGISPRLNGNSTGGRTDLPATLATFSNAASAFWARVSA